MLGEAFSVVSAILWAASTVITAKVIDDIYPLIANVLKTPFSSVCMVPIVLLMGEVRNTSNLDPTGLRFMILAAIIGLGLGDTCLFRSITLMGVSRSYMIAYTTPFFTMVLATIFLGDPFLVRYLVGAIIIFLGIVTVSANKSSKGKKISSRGWLTTLASAVLWSIGTL